MSLGPHNITFVSRGWDGSTRDRQNNPVVTELGTFLVIGCFIQQRDSDEYLDARETQVTLWDAMVPDPSPNVVNAESLARVEASSVGVLPDPGETYATFELDGAPDYAYHIDGTLHHIEAILRRVAL